MLYAYETLCRVLCLPLQFSKWIRGSLYKWKRSQEECKYEVGHRKLFWQYRARLVVMINIVFSYFVVKYNCVRWIFYISVLGMNVLVSGLKKYHFSSNDLVRERTQTQLFLYLKKNKFVSLFCVSLLNSYASNPRKWLRWGQDKTLLRDQMFAGEEKTSPWEIEEEKHCMIMQETRIS